LVLSLLILPFLVVATVAAAQDSPKVLFDETGTNGKFSTLYNIETYGSSSFAATLEKNGYSVSRLTQGPITAEKLQGYDTLILMAPERSYSDSEVNTIKQFVSNGGGLFLIGSNWGYDDGGVNFSYNKIAQGFGVSFANNEIVTDNKDYLIYPNFVKITNITANPITTNVPMYYHIMGTYIKNSGNSTVLAYTSGSSWGDQGYLEDGHTESNNIIDANETKGPLPVLSVMNYGKGKVIFMGATGTFVNSFIYRDNGLKLELNSVNWLSNVPTSSNYTSAGLINYDVGDLKYRIIGTVIISLLLLMGLTFKLNRDRKFENPLYKRSIKNWRYNGIIVLNSFFAILTGILFIPINYYLLDITIPPIYDPYLSYTLLITGILLLSFIVLILYNFIGRLRMDAKYSYINIVIILIFAVVTIILGDIYAFPLMQVFTVGSLILLIPFIVNLWTVNKYGSDMIIEGKEFNRLAKLSTKSLPYELHSMYNDSSYLGEGGFGRVFKAKRQDNVDVAIKIPKSFDKRSEKSFITEVSNWSRLNHPNIVSLYDYKILPIPYIETEFCEGNVEKGMKTLQEAISIVYDVAKGLQYAHSKNIIHGDVKISNILIKNGVNKISDWGLSKLKTEDSVTLSGATPSYAAPEQISQEFGRADERTDIYQLGNVFYELLTGRLPFEGEISQIYSSILKNEPIHPIDINPNASPVDAIIMKCLNKNKSERFADMGELLKELEKYRSTGDTVVFDR
jgi:eukaryotic-like serine/threonine-protein kinase